MPIPNQAGFNQHYNGSTEVPAHCAPGHGVVYIARVDRRCKIGISAKPRQRILGMETAIGRRLKYIYLSPQCLNYHELERRMHAALADRRDLGEWFRCDFIRAVQMMRWYYYYVARAPEWDAALRAYSHQMPQEVESYTSAPIVVPVRIRDMLEALEITE